MKLIIFALIPLILSIGISPAFPFSDAAQTEDSEMECRDRQIVVFRINSNNYVCVSQSTADKWEEYGIAEKVVPMGEVTQTDEMFMDIDIDGIVDSADLCPLTPDGIAVDSDGCAIPEMLEVIQVYDDGVFQLVEIAENIYSFGTSMGSFSLVLVTDDGIIIGDPVNQNHSEIMLKAIRTITDQPIKYLVYSHTHWDHTSGGQVFKNEGATILSHIDARDWLLENPNPNVIVADEVWEGNFKEIILGGKTLELHHFGPSHGEGMTVFYLPDDKITFIVDIVTPKRLGFTIMPDFSPKGWTQTLIEIEKLDFDTAMFGHKRAFGPASEVTEVREYLQDLRTEIFRMVQEGVNPFMIPSTIELPKYQEWEFYDEWLEMNTWRFIMEPHMGW